MLSVGVAFSGPLRQKTALVEMGGLNPRPMGLVNPGLTSCDGHSSVPSLPALMAQALTSASDGCT